MLLADWRLLCVAEGSWPEQTFPRARGERHVLHRTEEVRLPAAASRPLPGNPHTPQLLIWHYYVSESTYLHISEGWKVIPNQTTFKVIRIMICNMQAHILAWTQGKVYFVLLEYIGIKWTLRSYIILVSRSKYAWSKDREKNLYLCRKI